MLIGRAADAGDVGAFSARPATGRFARPALAARVRDGDTVAAVGFVVALAFALPCVHVVSQLLSDSYRTLYAGRWIAAHGVPHTEVFTVAAAGRPWVDQQWLAELTDFTLWRVGGYPLVALASAALVGVGYGVLAWVARRRGASLVLTIACCALAVLLALGSTFIRAQDFAFPLFAGLIALLALDLEHPHPTPRLLWLIPLFVAWANLHGSALIGIGLAVAYLAGRGVREARARRGGGAAGCAGLALACVLEMFATPYGTGVVRYYGQVLGNATIARAVPENRPPSLADPSGLAFFAALTVTVLLLLWAWRRRQRPGLVLVAGCGLTAGAAILASRNTVWFGMLAALLIAQTASEWLPPTPSTRRFRTVLLTVAASVTALGVLLLATPAPSRYESYTPLGAVGAAAAYAAQHPCLRILGDNASASALLWHDPALAGRVEFDARLEQYAPSVLSRWIDYQTATGPGWPASFGGAQLLLGSTRYNPSLVARLAALPAAVTLSHDATGIAVMTGPPPTGRCAR